MSNNNENTSPKATPLSAIENEKSLSKVSLRKIILSVLKDKNVDQKNHNSFDSDMKRIQRGFEKLITKLGGDVNNLKDGKNFSFDEDSVPFMKALLKMIDKNDGIIADFLNDRESDKIYSSAKIHNLIQEIIDESKKAGDDEDCLKGIANFLSTIFLESPIRSIEFCHMLIDALALNTADLRASEKTMFWLKFEQTLKAEYSCRITNLAFRIQTIAMGIQCSKKPE